MGIVKTIADFFRTKGDGKIHPIEKYNVVNTMMATDQNIKALTNYVNLLSRRPDVVKLFSGTVKPVDAYQKNAFDAYRLFTKSLSSSIRGYESKAPLSSFLVVLPQISSNIEQIEDNYSSLFTNKDAEKDEMTLRSSSLVAVGYMELAQTVCTWLTYLVAHVTAASNGELVTPFWSKKLVGDAKLVGEFLSNNADRWNPSHKGFLYEIQEMQRKGSDVMLTTGMSWLDEFVHDNQFTPAEQTLLSAAMRNPILDMASTGYIVRYQERLEYLNTTRDWLISKVSMEEAKLNGMDPSTPEYARLQKITENYADLVTKYERKIERMRG